ncbi:MAG: hypothetical protein IJ428_02800 [Clostridia bacterium]|nr:hypothetical protein [Clostridia bacterium]
MTEHLKSLSAASVFYFAKQLDNNTVLICDVTMMPLFEYHRTAYAFTLRLFHGSKSECATVEDVTCDRDKAEHIFNLLCTGNVYPCHLQDIIVDLIA